jgi:hypothetical protein
MLFSLEKKSRFPAGAGASDLLTALPRAAAAFARLEEALANHPLRFALLYRARLDAVRRQAAVDGQAIDPWHLAAVLEGLRLRMDAALRIIDRGQIFEAARHALTLYGWLTSPDLDQEQDIQQAEETVRTAPSPDSPLLAAALATHAWLDQGRMRPPIRTALVRQWTRTGLLSLPMPLTGARALAEDTPWERDQWIPVFLQTLADEADQERERLRTLEKAWMAARLRSGAQRRHSRAARAIDILAATPLLSATSLAKGLGMAANNAGLLLGRFVTEGTVIEVTHRSRRRLFGLAGLAPLREEVAPPYRSEPGRRPGRPRNDIPEEPIPLPAPDLPLGPIERASLESDSNRF